MGRGHVLALFNKQPGELQLGSGDDAPWLDVADPYMGVIRSMLLFYVARACNFNGSRSC